MAGDIKEQIINYMEKCRACTIATATTDGQPNIATVFFKNAGVDIYFNTGKDSQKVRNIQTNPRLAIAMQEEGPIPKEYRGNQRNSIPWKSADTGREGLRRSAEGGDSAA